MKNIKTVLMALAAFAAIESQAAYISFASLERQAGLGDAINVITGTGNASASVVNSENPTGNPLDPWVERGSVAGGTSGPGTLVDGLLEVTVLTGNWGSTPVTGTWKITDANFWTTYGYGAISLHVGNGQGDPDHWIWNLTSGKLSGTWDYSDFDGKGGGLSNLKLYSHGTGTTNVPDGGSTVALMGTALAGMTLIRRRK